MRQSWLFEAELKGGHVHIAIRCGSQDSGRALAGRIVVREDEWPTLRGSLTRGFSAIGAEIDVRRAEFESMAQGRVTDEVRLEIRTSGFDGGDIGEEAQETESGAYTNAFTADPVRSTSRGYGPATETAPEPVGDLTVVSLQELAEGERAVFGISMDDMTLGGASRRPDPPVPTEVVHLSATGAQRMGPDLVRFSGIPEEGLMERGDADLPPIPLHTAVAVEFMGHHFLGTVRGKAVMNGELILEVTVS